MIISSLQSLQPGNKIEFDLYLKDGRKFVSKGTEIKENYINRLKEIGIEYIYIYSEKFHNIDFEHPISNGTRTKAINVYEKMKKRIIANKDINEEEVKDIVKLLIEDIKQLRNPIAILNSLYPKDDMLAFHAINTAIISIGIGMQLSYNYSRLCDLALAGFIHDIGRELVEESSDLDERHVQKGFELLRKTQLFSIASTAVAYQHHEAYNGSGFPRGIKGEEIIEFAQIVSIADSYDTLISEQSEDKILHEKAYDEILNSSNVKFSSEIIKAFKNSIQVYFNGMIVLLDDGTQGVVLGQNVGHPLRPKIRIFSDSIEDYFKDIDLFDDIHKKVLYVFS